MTTRVSSPNTKKSRPFKKRKVQLNNMQVDNSSSVWNTYKSEDKDTVPNDAFKESIESSKCKGTETLLNGKNNEYHSVSNDTIDSIKLELPTMSDTESNISMLQKDNKDTLLLPIKKTEEEADTLTNKTTFETNLNSCKTECNVNSSQLSTPRKNLNKILNDAPSKRAKRSCRNASSTKEEKKVINEESTPAKRMKRKVSSISDYDQLSDTIKSELYDTTHLNGFEAIDLLHDLDGIMEFEDTKMSPDILISSMTPNKIMQNFNDLASELCNDPTMDPLFIESADEARNTSKITTRNINIKKTKNTTTKRKKTNSRNVKKPVSVAVNTRQRSKNYKTKPKTDSKEAVLSEESDSSEDNNEFSYRIKEELKDLRVQMVHTVPLQHRIEQSAGSRPPTQAQKNLFARYGPLRKGTFSPTEDQTIIQNWETFCKLHSWDPKNAKPFLYMRHQNQFYINSLQERQRFVQFLANGLPWRTLYSVHYRFRNLYEERKKTNHRYTAMEDNMILAYVKLRKGRAVNKTFSDLTTVLGRTRRSIWLRYQILKKNHENNENSLPKVEWTIPLVTKFIKNLLQVTLSKEVRELKNAAIPKPVWMKLEEKLSIDHNLLKTFWLQQLHMQLFCPRPIYLNDIKIQLIEYIYGKGISNTREIIWPNVAKYFEGLTSIFLCKLFFLLMREVTTKSSYTNFPDIVEYLYNTKIAEIQNDSTDKYLPRLLYKKGTIKVIKEDKSNYIHTAIPDNMDAE